MDQEHVGRVKDQMRQVGVTGYGMLKAESRYLPGLIQPDEQIGGAIYGQVGGLDSAMLVATDQRVIYLDKKFLFSETDVISYSAISGVNRTRVGLFSSVVLHTRLGDYTFRYVNGKAALIFVKYIQSQRLHDSEQDGAGEASKKSASKAAQSGSPVFHGPLDERALRFLTSHDTAVISTIDSGNNPHGAVVYYQVDQDNVVYILTKIQTSKAQNTLRRSPVALTVYDPERLQTLQLRGFGQVESGQKLAVEVYRQIMKTRAARGETSEAPVAKLRAGDFTVIKISIATLNFMDYSEATKTQ